MIMLHVKINSYMAKEKIDRGEEKKEKPKVKDYMTTDVVVVKPEDTVKDIAKLIKKTGHNGFPVVERGYVKGYISARDILLKNTDEPVYKLMSRDITLADGDMNLDDAARLMFREGVSKLPVVRETGRVIGLISNSDVIRSQIERANPRKIYSVKRTLEEVHGIDVGIEKGLARVDDLVPTQECIHEDELKGRIYELEKGLAEPIVVVEKPNKILLVDGHHRAVAAKELDIQDIEAYKLKIDIDTEIGLEKVSRKTGIEKLDDIRVIDYSPHPMIKLTKKYGKEENKS